MITIHFFLLTLNIRGIRRNRWRPSALSPVQTWQPSPPWTWETRSALNIGQINKNSMATNVGVVLDSVPGVCL